jgi:peptidyl-prolyl cis-trans isomerase C
MRSNWRLALIPVACLSVGACKLPWGGQSKAPTGQVVATVDGKEITLRDLKAEMAGANLPSDPKAMKAAEEQALQGIVNRKILAKDALDQKLDQSPDFALQKQKLTEALLVQTLQNKLIAQVPKPSPEEVDRYITDHPDLFAQRKVFVVDQIQMARPTNPDVIKGLQPLKTLEQVQTYLTDQKIPFKRDTGALDAVGADPRLIEAILKLPAGEVFVIPSQNGLLVNQIRDTKVVPFTGPQATDYATKLITRQRTQEAVGRQLQAMVQKGAPDVKYNPAYQPPAPKAAPAAAPAAAG